MLRDLLPLSFLLHFGILVYLVAERAFSLDKRTSEFRSRKALIFVFSLNFLFNAWLLLSWLGASTDGAHTIRYILFSFRFPNSEVPFTISLSYQLSLLGVIYGVLGSALFGIVLRFSLNYLSGDPGFVRFFSLLSLLSFGVQSISYSADLESLFVGWELVGLSSVFLISFFRTNWRALSNSVRALIFYRICDGSILIALALSHSHSSSTGHSALSQWIGIFLVIASLGKSGQFPFSNWLFRAMEGPTGSSAVYYGALATHLGPFLLMHSFESWFGSIGLRWLVGGLGLITAVYSSLVGAVRSDVKTKLAFQTQAQVGLIFVEIALGWVQLALVHIVLHATLRTWEFLRAASFLQDFHNEPSFRLNRAMTQGLFRKLPLSSSSRFYGAALRGFFLDEVQDRLVVRPFLAIAGRTWGKVLMLILCLSFAAFDHWVGAWLVLGLTILLANWTKSGLEFGILSIALSQLCIASAGFVPPEGNATQLAWDVPSPSLHWGSILMAINAVVGAAVLAGCLRYKRTGLYTVVSVLWLGSPIGLAFIAEDLLFHEFLRGGLALVTLLAGVMSLNLIKWYRDFAMLGFDLKRL